MDQRDSILDERLFKNNIMTATGSGIKQEWQNTTKEDMAAQMDMIFKELNFLREAGQKEYARGNDDAFRNFRSLGTELGLTKESVLWVYLKKHLDGILSYINGHRSQREDVRGRINDAIVYLCLLRGMVEENDRNKHISEVQFQPRKE